MNGANPGKRNKVLTHRIERKRALAALKREVAAC